MRGKKEDTRMGSPDKGNPIRIVLYLPRFEFIKAERFGDVDLIKASKFSYWTCLRTITMLLMRL